MSVTTLAILDALEGGHDSGSQGSSGSRYLTPLGNTPLIRHVVAQLAEGGIERVRIVTANGLGSTLESVLGDGNAWGVSLSCAEAGIEAPEHDLLRETAAAVEEESVLAAPADCLFPDQIAPLRARFDGGDFDLVLLARSSVRRGRGLAAGLATAEVDPAPREGVGEPEDRELPALRPRRILDTAMVLGSAALEPLEQLIREERDQGRLLDTVLSAGCRYAISRLGAHWCYSDSTAELLLGNQLALDLLPMEPPPDRVADGSTLAGRLEINPSATIRSSTIRGPVAIDQHAVVEDSFVGPHTAIGAGAVVRGAEIENAIVLPGARIEHPGCRIESSVIGECAQISRSFDLPRGLHVRLGRGARVILS